MHLELGGRHGHHQPEYEGERGFHVAAEHGTSAVRHQRQCMEGPHLERGGGGERERERERGGERSGRRRRGRGEGGGREGGGGGRGGGFMVVTDFADLS